MNLPKIRKDGTEKPQQVKIHRKPKTTRYYERVSDIVDFYNVISKHGSRVAYSYFDKERKIHDVTYAELSALMKHTAAGFDAVSLSGEKIAVVGETSVEWVASYLGVLASGSIVIPMDKELEISQIEAFLEDVEATAIVYSASFNGKFDEAKKNHKTLKSFIAIAPDENELANEKTIAFSELCEKGKKSVAKGYSFPPVTNRDALAELLFTSGTTGTSKKVMLSQKNIFSVVSSAAATVEFTPDDVIVSVLPIHHTYAFYIGIPAA